ncbi:MAG: hypothetical protein QNJ35_13530, partial [Paracoccaceae bacterium]|nr:hypothetical protein [Paracoccaceae bacterium]
MTPDIEILPIGDSLVFRNRGSRALVLSNPAAAEVLKARLAGRTVAEIAGGIADDPADAPDLEAMIGDTLAAWERAGLFRTDRLEDAFPAPPKAPAPLRASFALAGRGFELRSDCADTFGLMTAFFADYRTFDPVADAAVLRIGAMGEDHAAWLDEAPLWRTGDRDETRFVAMRAGLACLAGGAAIAAVLHA